MTDQPTGTEFQEILAAVIEQARDSRAVQALLDGRLSVAFETTSPRTRVTLHGRDAQFWYVLGDIGETEDSVDVTFTSSLEAAHDFWMGRLNVPTALALGTVRVRGSLEKALALTDVLSELHAFYRATYAQHDASARGGPSDTDAGDTPAARETRFPRPAQAGPRTVRRGLDHASLPMRLYHQAKRHGAWDPRGMDFARDREDWLRLRPGEQDALLTATSLFAGAEDSVTLNLLPLVQVVAREGRVEEEMYLTTFLSEKARRTELLDRLLREVLRVEGDRSDRQGDTYRRVFHEELPAAMRALTFDSSPAAQATASVTYHMIVEGVLATTGYRAFHVMLAARDVMPGLRGAVDLLRRSEERHVAFGMYFLTRLVREHPDVWAAVEARMQELLPIAVRVIPEALAPHDPSDALGLDVDALLDDALLQFRKRLARLERARDGRSEDPPELPAE